MATGVGLDRCKGRSAAIVLEDRWSLMLEELGGVYGELEQIP
jgi:hypothetical protein